MAVIDRFLKKVNKTETCWLWIGSKSGNGDYGSFFDQKFWPAHRWSYHYFNGPVPTDKYVCHKCDVPACVNPEHLFLGTPSDNYLDAVKKGRSGSTPKLTTEQVVECRLLTDLGVPFTKLAKRYGVSSEVAKSAGKRKGYKWVGEIE